MNPLPYLPACVPAAQVFNVNGSDCPTGKLPGVTGNLNPVSLARKPSVSSRDRKTPFPGFSASGVAGRGPSAVCSFRPSPPAQGPDLSTVHRRQLDTCLGAGWGWHCPGHLREPSPAPSCEDALNQLTFDSAEEPAWTPLSSVPEPLIPSQAQPSLG